MRPVGTTSFEAPPLKYSQHRLNRAHINSNSPRSSATKCRVQWDSRVRLKVHSLRGLTVLHIMHLILTWGVRKLVTPINHETIRDWDGTGRAIFMHQNPLRTAAAAKCIPPSAHIWLTQDIRCPALWVVSFLSLRFSAVVKRLNDRRRRAFNDL